jgi:hypothetical protein
MSIIPGELRLVANNTPASEKLPRQSLALATGTISPRCDLAPATRQQGKAELGGCLTLVSPSGLTAEDRTEWLAVAMRTLSGIPADLLADGCAEARKRCRFPSEIVPTVMAAVEQRWKWRIEDAARPVREFVSLPSQAADTSPLVDPAEVRKLIASIGQ